MSIPEMIFVTLRDAACVLILLLCIERAVLLDGPRSKWQARWAYWNMATSSFGLIWLHWMPHWMLQVCVLMFLGGSALLLWVSAEEWKGGAPMWTQRKELRNEHGEATP